jgi:hypothetical protein
VPSGIAPCFFSADVVDSVGGLDIQVKVSSLSRISSLSAS